MNIKLNKNDVILIICILFISLFFILILNSKNKKDNIAKVYYDNKLIKQINLNKNNTYEVKGYNGTVKLEVKNNKIRVIEEKSPLHLCSKYGYISKSYETIVCLPNKIVIEIDGNDIDTIVK